MGVADLFKTKDPGDTAPTGDSTQTGDTPEESKQDREETFEEKSARLAQAVEDARDGMDLGDIPAKDDHPYHLAVQEHRAHESKRKR